MIAAAALAVAIVFFASRRRGARGATTYLERLFGQRTSQLQKINAQLREEIEERKRHEAALRESEERHRLLFENAADPIYNVELRTGKIIMANRALIDQSGYSAEELTGTRFTKFIPKKYWPLTLGLLKDAVVGSRKAAQFQVEYLHRSGELRPIEVSAIVMKGPNGRRIAQCIARDITERKEAEDALKRAEAHLRAVVANLPVVVYALDGNGVFTLSEGTGLRALGRTPGQVVGKSIFDVYHDVPEILGSVRAGLSGQSSKITVELSGVTFDAYYEPVRDEKGEVTGVVGIGADVTDQKLAEKKLTESEDRLRSVIENAVDGIFVIDSDGRVLEINQRACDDLGYTRGEMIGMSVEVFSPIVTPEVLARVFEQITSEGPLTLEQVHQRSDGTTYPAEVRVGFLQWNEGKCLICVARDVSERKRVQRAMEQSEQRFRTVFEFSPIA